MPLALCCASKKKKANFFSSQIFTSFHMHKETKPAWNPFLKWIETMESTANDSVFLFFSSLFHFHWSIVSMIVWVGCEKRENLQNDAMQMWNIFFSSFFSFFFFKKKTLLDLYAKDTYEQWNWIVPLFSARRGFFVIDRG